VAAGSECAEYRNFGFIADLVAAGLPLACIDPVDEWLQVALALRIEIFSESPPLPFGNRERLGCLNGSIRGR
jgi:hypothetical protein